jgi:hypothetical protein
MASLILLLIYRIKSRTTSRRASTHYTFARPYMHAAIVPHETLPGGELNPRSPFGEVGYRRFTV